MTIERDENEPWVAGYSDGYATTSPVGSFAPNMYGIHDLGGNAWEWCEDFFDGAGGEHVLRGGSWVSYGRGSMLSSARISGARDERKGYGFRCVVEFGAGGRSTSTTPGSAP